MEQPVVSTADDMDPVAHLAISDAATCDQLAAEAVAAEVTANEAAAATDPPAAQVAKAALASKALTVKERLAACVATERNRITFGQGESCVALRQRLQCRFSYQSRRGILTCHRSLPGCSMTFCRRGQSCEVMAHTNDLQRCSDGC